MSEMKDIVIIGAGYAGIHAAKKLAKKYQKDDSVRITLIDRNSYHTMLTELHEVAGARVEPNAVRMDLQRVLKRTKVNLVTDNVTHVDHDKKVVTTEHGSYSYDYLMLGMGSEPNDFGVPGVKDYGFTLWSWEDAMEIRQHIESIVEKASKVHDIAKRREMLTFAIAGSGFTGIEMVGELIEWRERLAKNSKIDPNEIRLMVVEAAPTILNLLPKRSDADNAEKYMVKQGVEILKNSLIVELKENAVVLKSGEEIPTQTLIWTAGIKANSDAAEYGMKSGRAGRLLVNEYMEANGLENVYVMGDLAYFEETEGQPTPQIVEAAEQTAICAAKSVIAEISGGEKTPYKGNYHGFMVSIGARYGVADVGGMHLKGWFAILVKHMVNLYYFFGIRSGYYMFQYVMHEFFHVKDKRQMFRGTLTRYGNVLWSLCLRIFLGFFWINQAMGKIFGHEAWDKVGEGFENMVGFRGIFAGIGNLFSVLTGGIGEDSWLLSDSVKMNFEWLHDAASGATTAATSAATSAATGGGSEWAEPIIGQSPAWFQFFMRIFMPNADIAIFGQQVIVFFQLAIGLALIVGLFTWLCSFASAGLLVVLLFSAMLGWDNAWAIPASIALMNGAGRSLGLDYYVVPWLQKKIGNWWYGKESSIYSVK